MEAMGQEEGSPGHAAQLPVGALPVPTGSRAWAGRTGSSGDPGGQSCPSEVAFNLPANNRLF